MKRNYIFSVLSILLWSFSGCESLDYAPANQLNDKNFWKTEKHAHEAAVGLYTAMKANWAFGCDFTFDMISDLADGTSPHAGIARGTTFSSADGSVQNAWQYLYELVHRSNTVIRNVPKMSIDLTVKNEVIGEAKFLRAMAYFRMLNAWGGVPYYDESCSVEYEYATLSNPRESAETIRKHILEDLTDAIEKLPVSWSSSDYGRATKGAAYALRGKVYLYNREWKNAIADFEEIVYNKSHDYGYELHPDYNELFRLYNDMRSKEMIFSIQALDGNVAGHGLELCTYLGNKSTMRLIASNCIVPSTRLVDMYENADGTPFDWDDVFPGYNAGDSEFRRNILSVAINQESTKITDVLNCDTAKVADAYRRRDPRLCLNVITPYSYYLGTDAGSVPMDKQFVLHNPQKGGSPMEAQAFIRNSEGWNSYFWRKFIPTGNLDGYWGEYTRVPYEFPLIRLGDVLLMLAEAYNEDNRLEDAVKELNKVRERVGMPGLNNGDTWMAVSSREEMSRRIQNERAYELVAEGHRYWDLKRWGIYASTVRNATDIYGDLMFKREYQSRHELWPIPLVEMERNPSLKGAQNPGW